MKLQKNVQFQLEEAVEIPKWADAYPENKFTVFKTCFLSTKPNSHKLEISGEVLKRDAKSILGNFLVAKLEYGDATTHKDTEIIYGYFPMEQDVEFVEEDGIIKAYAYAVVSRRYSKEFNGIFEFDNLRNSSVEMTVETVDGNDDVVAGIDIYGLTCLGKTVNGSCPDADIRMVRFAQEEAETYFGFGAVDALTTMKMFVKERNNSMGKTYKIDKSKESMSDRPWGEVDKTELRNKIMEADNKSELVKAVYMLVEDGWEDAPSEHLKYPVMELKGDTFVYNRDGLASALGYARKENETTVIDKVEKIYKSLGLDDSDGKEEKEMSEIETTFAEEEEKEAEVKKDEETEELAEVESEEKEEESEDKAEEFEAEDGKAEDEHVEMSVDEMMAKIAELQGCVEEKDNIIMEKDKDIADKDAELEALRKFKSDIEDRDKATAVEKIMSEVSKFIDKDTAESFRREGLAVSFAELDAWSNKVKASIYDKALQKKDKSDDCFKFSAPIAKSEKSDNVWDRLN